MGFIHDSPEFGDLLRVVSTSRGIDVALVEKDYWVTQALWALEQHRFEFWLKGGTSLSKGFGLIERFSEDLDLKIEPGAVTALPGDLNWRSEGAQAIADRERYFRQLARSLDVPGATLELDREGSDAMWRSANLRVRYPHREEHAILRPFVLLEVGSARVTPYVERGMTSFVHEHLDAIGQREDFEPNRPQRVRCLHPVVTLIEKIDALQHRFGIASVEPAAFVRHFEDAAQIIRRLGVLPPLAGYDSPAAIATEMWEQRQIRRLPGSDDASFRPDDGARWNEVRRANAAIAPMFWGPRIGLDEACAAIREWIRSNVDPIGD